jgi:hypothetical protein
MGDTGARENRAKTQALTVPRQSVSPVSPKSEGRGYLREIPVGD